MHRSSVVAVIVGVLVSLAAPAVPALATAGAITLASTSDAGVKGNRST
jgi:hypothetical protein